MGPSRVAVGLGGPRPGTGLPPHSLPRRQPPRGIAPARIFFRTTAPGSDQRRRSAGRPERRERGPPPRVRAPGVAGVLAGSRGGDIDGQAPASLGGPSAGRRYEPPPGAGRRVLLGSATDFL